MYVRDIFPLDPLKGLGRASPEALFPQKLEKIVGETETDVDFVAPYFVPGAEGVDEFVALAERR